MMILTVKCNFSQNKEKMNRTMKFPLHSKRSSTIHWVGEGDRADIRETQVSHWIHAVGWSWTCLLIATALPGGARHTHTNTHTHIHLQVEPTTTFWRINRIYYASSDDFRIWSLNPNKCTLRREAQ